MHGLYIHAHAPTPYTHKHTYRPTRIRYFSFIKTCLIDHILPHHVFSFGRLSITQRHKFIAQTNYGLQKGKGSFYIAQYPVRWTTQSASHVFPPLADLFIPTPFSASPGSILATLQLRAKTKSLTFPPLSIARYSFKLSQLGRQWRERKCAIFETVAKRDLNPGSLDCESGILPLSYRAPLIGIYSR